MNGTVDFTKKRNGAPPPPSVERPYRLESAAELAAPLPPLEWICQSLRIARGSLTLFAGYGYSRKSLVAQDLALSASTGTDALGIFRTAHVNVVHEDREQGHRITRERYQRLARARGVELVEARLQVSTFPRYYLTDEAARDVVRRMIDDSRAGLLILDSFRASLRDVDENSSEVREYLDLVAQEVKPVNAAAIVIHHARKPASDKAAGKYSLRGSGAIFDALDGCFVFSGDKGQPSSVDHEKDRLIGTEIDSFGLDSVDVERDGNPRWGLRLVHQDAMQVQEREAVSRARMDDAERELRTKKIAEAMALLPNATWKGTRTTLAKHVGGKSAPTMAALSALVSVGRVIEDDKRKELRWVA